MRQILINHVRDQRALKRRPTGQRVDLTNVVESSGSPSLDLLELDDCIRDLSRHDPRQAQVVELRYFGGLTIDETARVMGLSTDTIKIEWRMAKAWLRVRLDAHDGS